MPFPIAVSFALSFAASVPRGINDGYPLQPRPSTAASAGHFWLRYCYEGGTLKREGRLLPLAGADPSLTTGSHVISALAADGADLERFDPRVYDREAEGWALLTEATSFDVADRGVDGETPCRRIDIQLTRSTAPAPALSSPSEGYCTIGVVGLKRDYNLGTLWRGAYQLGAASLFVVGDRYEPQSSDTVSAWRHVPLVQHADWNAFAAAQPYGAVWVAVEMGGESSLEAFEHPERACYILGSEDSGLPASVLRACHRRVSLPAVRYESFNVAAAGSIVLYDRLAKQRRRAAPPAMSIARRPRPRVRRTATPPAMQYDMRPDPPWQRDGILLLCYVGVETLLRSAATGLKQVCVWHARTCVACTCMMCILSCVWHASSRLSASTSRSSTRRWAARCSSRARGCSRRA